MTNDIQRGELLGEWQLIYREDGTVSYIRHDIEVISGTYSVSGDELTMIDEGGLYASVGDGARSTYRWAVAGDGALRLTAVDDPVPERQLVLASHPWTKVP